MAANGSYHMAWGPGTIVPGTNTDNSHNPANFGSNQGIVTGCGGPVSSPQSAAGNPGYQYNSSSAQKGGYGYGFSPTQNVVGNYPMGIDKYANLGVKDPFMLGTSTQYNPAEYPLSSIPRLNGGRRRHVNRSKRNKRGGAVNYFYGYTPQGEGSMSTFAGSGYPEITKGQQCAGAKKSRKHMKRRHNATRKHSNKLICPVCGDRFNNKKQFRNHLRNSSKSMSSSRHRMRSELFKKVRGGRKTHKQRGGYHQYLSNQPFSLTYETGGSLSPSLSALANPVIFKPTNNCSDPFGPPK
ncbi:MAG: hypothetical protein WD512_19885 [Candidatus Paceibacterota bacterium]